MGIFGRLFGTQSRRSVPNAHTLALEDELRQLTNQVIRDSKTDMWKDYRKQIAGYNRDNAPLGEEEAKKILLLLIRKAVTQRSALSGDIERSVSEGSLYSRYFDKVAAINEMTNDTYMKMKRMQALQQQLAGKRKLYRHVTGRQYLGDVGRAVRQSQSESGAVDIGEEIDKVGGVMDEGQTVD